MLDYAPLGFALTRGAGVGKTLLHLIYLRIEEPVAANEAGIEQAERGHGLKSLVGLCGLGSIASAAAVAKNPHALGIDSGISGEHVGGAVNILHSVGGAVGAAGLSSAGALISGVEGKSDISFPGHNLGIVASLLFFHAPVGMGHYQSRIFLRRVVAGRRIDIGGNAEAVEIVGNRVDVHFTGLVGLDGVVVHKSVGIAFVGEHILYGYIFENRLRVHIVGFLGRCCADA